MNTQPNSPEENSATGIFFPEHLGYPAHVGRLVHIMLFRSHSPVFLLPVTERSYDNPLTEEEQNRLIHDVEQQNPDHRRENVLRAAEADILRFATSYILPKFITANTHSVFFDLCLSLDIYLDHVAEWLDTAFASLNQDQQDSSVGIILTNIFYRQIQSRFRADIITHFVNRARAIRNSHSYLSDWAYHSLHSARFMKIIRTFQTFYDTDGPEHTMLSWNQSYGEVVQTHFRDTMSSIYELREFLAIVEFGFNLEWDLYTKIFAQPLCTKGEFKAYLFESIRELFFNRFWRSHFFNFTEMITADDSRYDGKLLSDLFHLLCYNDHSFFQMMRILKSSLRGHFKEHCIKRIENMFSENIHSPQWNLGNTMATYWDICLSYTSRLRGEIHGVLPQEQIECIKKHFSEGMFRRIGKRRAVTNIDKLSKACADYLCGMNGPGQGGMNLEAVIHFYMTVANREALLNHAKNNLLRNTLKGTGHSHQYLISFCQDERVEQLPKKLSALASSIEESKTASRALNEDMESIASVADANLTVSGIVFHDKYWPEYEDNLLRVPQELFHSNGRFADKHKAQNNLRPEDKLNVQNAKSMVQIKTKVFGVKKKEVTLKLSVYQLSVFRCLRQAQELTVGDLYSQLIRPELTGSDDELKAKKVVKLVLISLVRPYQFLQVFAHNSRDKELRPSKPEKISRHHYIKLNRELELADGFLELEKPDLTISNLDEVNYETDSDVEASAPRTRTHSSGSVAMNSVLTYIRRRCDESESGYVNEEEAMSQISDRMRGYGLRREDLQGALENHIREGTIERFQEGETSMLKCITRNNAG